MATPNPTEPKTTKSHKPPKPGTRPSVRADAAVCDDFAVIMSAGGTASDAIRAAVAMLADMYRTGWAHGVCAPGTAPRLLAYQLQQCPTVTPALISGRAPVSDRRTSPRTVSPRLPHPPTGRHLSA
ncbi:hypothetical protein OG520_10860 [Streptomyces sp. NBC_00984]|uniref:hypothetical protein n=1 Tax=Streptomyces sp. NBC_00984 TaxID=2903700 RepID=UPI00386424F5|nr:hypothetical protein OG520_10860 [Streptomyces sp. NBC_00984]